MTLKMLYLPRFGCNPFLKFPWYPLFLYQSFEPGVAFKATFILSLIIMPLLYISILISNCVPLWKDRPLHSFSLRFCLFFLEFFILYQERNVFNYIFQNSLINFVPTFPKAIRPVYRYVIFHQYVL